MKVRIKFQKYGSMKFIGHLDVMRYFQKLFRRADIDNEYTKGYSPHQVMSFAAPLGVGLTSDGEYLDIELRSSETPEVMLERMNAAATEGIRMIGFHPLLDQEENKKVITAMSLVASADYLVSLKDGYSVGEFQSQEKFRQSFEQFLSEQEIIIDKKTKKSEKAVDIRPMITLAAFDERSFEDRKKDILMPEVGSENIIAVKPASVAEQYRNNILVYLQMHTGSAANLKPELVMEAYYNYLGIPFQEFAWQVHRLEVYTRDQDSQRLIPLDQLER